MATSYTLPRAALGALRAWSHQDRRKPLVVRGARQVGKSFLVRRLAEEEGLDLLEANLEKTASLATIFRAPDPAGILAALELRLRRRVDPARTLLFLDEIQAAPEAFRSLRYFHEEMPDL